MMKRIAVWFIETLSEALLLGVALALLLGYDPHEFLKAVSIYSAGIIMVSVSSGYLITTIIARAVWKGRTLWSYSVIAIVLFFTHFEIINLALGPGGAFEPSLRLRVRVAGACIVCVCTVAGTFALRKWTPTRSGLAGVPSGG